MLQSHPCILTQLFLNFLIFHALRCLSMLKCHIIIAIHLISKRYLIFLNSIITNLISIFWRFDTRFIYCWLYKLIQIVCISRRYNLIYWTYLSHWSNQIINLLFITQILNIFIRMVYIISNLGLLFFWTHRWFHRLLIFLFKFSNVFFNLIWIHCNFMIFFTQGWSSNLLWWFLFLFRILIK